MHDPAIGRVESTVRAGSGEAIVPLDFSADGRYLAAGGFGGTATLWTRADGTEYAVVPPPPRVADSVGEYTTWRSALIVADTSWAAGTADNGGVVL